MGYAFWSYRTLIEKRLYLPEEWANDSDRRERCSVPEEITFKTKAEWGWEVLLNARKGNLPFGWVGMDCFYGQQPWFLDKLDGENFLLILQLKWKDKAPMLTIQDVRAIREVILPKRSITKRDIMDIIKEKHKTRESARRSHHKKNSKA